MARQFGPQLFHSLFERRELLDLRRRKRALGVQVGERFHVVARSIPFGREIIAVEIAEPELRYR